MCIFAVIPIIGCLLVLAICESEPTGGCKICSKKVYFNNEFCHDCKKTYEVKDTYDLRLAKEKYKIAHAAKEKAVDKEIKYLRKEFYNEE